MTKTYRALNLINFPEFSDFRNEKKMFLAPGNTDTLKCG